MTEKKLLPSPVTPLLLGYTTAEYLNNPAEVDNKVKICEWEISGNFSSNNLNKELFIIETGQDLNRLKRSDGFKARYHSRTRAFDSDIFDPSEMRYSERDVRRVLRWYDYLKKTEQLVLANEDLPSNKMRLTFVLFLITISSGCLAIGLAVGSFVTSNASLTGFAIAVGFISSVFFTMWGEEAAKDGSI